MMLGCGVLGWPGGLGGAAFSVGCSGRSGAPATVRWPEFLQLPTENAAWGWGLGGGGGGVVGWRWHCYVFAICSLPLSKIEICTLEVLEV